jgi:hypothetical protein
METGKRGFSEEPRADGYYRDQDINDPRFAPYRYARSGPASTDPQPDETVPLFLSNLANQARQRALEEAWETDHREEETWGSDYYDAKYDTKPIVARRLVKTGILAAAAIATAFAFLSLEDRSGLIDKVSNSITAMLPTFSIALGRSSTPAVQTVAIDTAPAMDQAPADVPSPVTTVAPTREAIASAFQTALQSQPKQDDLQQPQAASPPSPPPRRIDPDEVAALLKRAKGMIDVGDIGAARLLLERAAGANEPKAALLLAQTYDPAVLGTLDMRSITPDPAMARSWYQKAAELGSADAQQRLSQMQN